MMHRKGFTMLEVLVVLVIMALLLAILLPSFNQSRETARRAACLAQLHQMFLGQIAYATDSHGEFTPGPVVTDGSNFGVYLVWNKSPLSSYVPNAPWNYYRGNGYLVKAGYIKNPRVLYCPSWSHKEIYYGDPSDPTDAQFAGWTTSGDPTAAQTYIYTSYHYRSSFKFNKNNSPICRSARLDVDKSSEFLIGDHFTDSSRGVEQCHKTGYNYVTLGGTGGWQNDNIAGLPLTPSGTTSIEHYSGSSDYHTGNSGYALQEEVFSKYFH